MKKLIAFFVCLFAVTSVNAQLNMNLLGNRPYSQNLSDVWGYVDGSGNEYAIVGVQDSISIVDVTNPSNMFEVFSISGPSSIWRDMMTYNNHAYVVHDDGFNGVGLTIIDLNPLPGSTNLPVSYYTGSTYTWGYAHNLYIDENGVLYIFGADYGVGGAIMLDISVDPKNPTELGIWDTYYIHDGVVKGDTLYAACLTNGLVAVDVSDKANPTIMTSWATPNNFAHNCWFSDDNDYLFTTDEKSDAYIAGYDITDFSNVFETDRIQSALTTTGVIPHNTHYIDGYLVTSYYTDGIHVTDANRPTNLVRTAYYDTSPSYSGNGFNGAWGVYPWLPSGNILVGDIQEGLTILGATYERACYLEGTVTDSLTGIPINNAGIQIASITLQDNTDISGEYKTGTPNAGSYSVQFSKSGYVSKIVNGVSLTNGVVTTLDVELVPAVPITLNGSVVDQGGNSIANVPVILVDQTNGTSFNVTADGTGSFSIPNFFTGLYEITAGQWGYITTCSNVSIGSTSPVVITLDNGYYDDFTFDFGWNVASTASAGIWERGEPNGTSFGGSQSNPEVDVNGDCLDQCYVTGNSNFGGVGTDDVDDGYTILESPVFDATILTDPHVNFYTWFFNGGNGTLNDTLIVHISDGSTSAELVRYGPNSPNNSSWVFNDFRISDFITPTSTMTLSVTVWDAGTGHLVEGGLDVFSVVQGGVGIGETPQSLILNAYPNPFDNNIKFTFDRENISAESIFVLTDITGKIVFEEVIKERESLTIGEELAKGVYLSYIVSSNRKSSVIKVVKQ